MLVARVIPTEEESLSLGYTKHYYAGTQRVSSKIGTTENLGDFLQDWLTQGTGGPVDAIGSSMDVLENAEEGVLQVYDELGIEAPEYNSSPTFIPVASFIHGDDEIEQYWFHPDHLGSTSYITNALGEVSQHMEYFAFGETFVEEHRSSNNSPYKFNGKELDEDTGWYYYGARYYDPRISVWLSVDPLMEKTLQPYQYTYQNPIAFIDHMGMIGEDWVKRKDGSIYWDNNANDQATTKSDETYLGKDLRIGIDSYIDKDLWDGPDPLSLGLDLSGSKLTSDIWIHSEENDKGELTGISTEFSSVIKTNKAGFKGVKIDNLPDVESSVSFYDKENNFIGFSIQLEKHAKVNGFEEAGLLMMGYQAVNVAQRVDVNYIGKDLNISFKTDVFPSATGGIRGERGDAIIL